MSSRLPAGYRRYLIGNYQPQPAVFTAGKGARLRDRRGRDYVDFACGVAVTALGHAHPAVTRAIAAQAAKLTHISNVFIHDQTVAGAKLLAEATGMERVFFCNSGAEANEAALKIARKRGAAIRRTKTKVVSFAGSFHGRLGFALAASGQPKLWQDFGPLAPGFVHVPFDDPRALERAFGRDVCAAIVEPIQGEGGIRAPKPAVLALLQKLCRRHDALLIADEIQTGMHRTGPLLASAATRLRPDMATLGKGIGNGFPLGAVAVRGAAGEVLRPGDHGTTYGGNALAMAALRATLGQLRKPALQRNVAQASAKIAEAVAGYKKRGAPIRQLRGRGLLLGLALDEERLSCGELASRAFAQGLLTVPAGDNVLRLLPPLNIAARDLAAGLRRLEAALFAKP
ncbi:MAG: acetylornithine/succinylornithine family transaminase [Betaproteobacteria bacterium AqS2]|uniref:Acetylornithine/succinylornithine family transaminase n=1 Tax=Candidatus Amphirhobacter heronislandensis TaxID=1732024 RepID=A0A930UIX2_9GAMM|nr:acetylornithine/succinylornithine family transaminase [Betaproteobacteria bacterium AqS2]